LLGATINSFSLQTTTIANQNAQPAFVAMLTYIGLIYAFLGDYFLLHLSFSWVEMTGVAIVITFCLILMTKKLCFIVEEKKVVEPAVDDFDTDFRKMESTAVTEFEKSGDFRRMESTADNEFEKSGNVKKKVI
jgi:hypothetical protein